MTHVTVKQTTGAAHDVAIDVVTATVLDLKLKVQELLHCPPEAQRLIFQGRVLDEKATLASYALTDGLTVHLVINAKLVPAATPTPAPSATTAAASSAQVSLASLLPLLKQTTAGVAALATLKKMAENIVNHPTEEKYRKIRLSNEALKKKVLDVPHGLACVHAMGFAAGVEEGFLVLVPTATNWEHLVASKRLLDQASAPAAAPAFAPSAAPAFAPSAVPGGLGSDPLQGMQAMLQNPMLASMLQNDPRIQQMAQGNPMLQQALANPAMLQQALGAVQNNPMMRQQMQQMMANPQLMEQMMQGGALPASPYGMGYGQPPAAASPFGAPVSLSSTPPTTAPPASTVAPARAAPVAPPARSEEDEIAEAIARSLREM